MHLLGYLFSGIVSRKVVKTSECLSLISSRELKFQKNGFYHDQGYLSLPTRPYLLFPETILC